ncbi:hypothetical protein M422DRAFT_247673 [Sphaerobolus stellatus SS14]|nr:hypothetical protein M422DRAFT_247673 [Sphaerobolus stellatus SS14]
MSQIGWGICQRENCICPKDNREWKDLQELISNETVRKNVRSSVMVEKVVQARPAVQTDPGLSGAV